MPRKVAPPSVTDKLRELQSAAAICNHAAREADATAHLALTEVEAARRARVEAHAGGDSMAIRDALASYQQADKEAEDATLAAEGARLAADRAQAEVEAFKTNSADDLIAALEPEARAATAELTHHAQALVDAAARWRAVADQTDDFLRSHPRATPALDGAPSEHGLEAAVRAVRAAPEPQPPLPTWIGVAHRQAQDDAHRHLLRKRRLPASEQAEA